MERIITHHKFHITLKTSLNIISLPSCLPANDKYPKRGSMRIALAAWWLGTFIISVAYSANLVAILSVVVESYPVNSLEELSIQTQHNVLLSGGTALVGMLQVRL